MNNICKMMAVAAVSIAASLSANAETPALPEGTPRRKSRSPRSIVNSRR